MAKSKSTFGALVPLIVTVILLAVVAAVGFLAYQIAVDVADKTSKKMEKKNVSLSKDGLKVGVKEVSAEQIGDSTQSILVKTWNNASSNMHGSPVASPSTDKRRPFSKT